MLCGQVRAAFESLHESNDPLLVERRLFHHLRDGARENETRPLLRVLQRSAPERAGTAAAPYDDQGNDASTLSAVNPTGATITLGAWSSDG